jgi:hypothetical protein
MADEADGGLQEGLHVMRVEQSIEQLQQMVKEHEAALNKVRTHNSTTFLRV